MRIALAFVLLAALAPVSGARARSIDDCEKISNPMLYNACLAEFSPAARRTGPSRAAGAVAPAYDPPPRSGYRRQKPEMENAGGIVVQHTKGGRKVATFYIIAPEKSRRRRR